MAKEKRERASSGQRLSAQMDSEQSDTDILQRRNRELSIIFTIAEALNAEVGLTHALNTTLSITLEFFNLQTGWVWLMNEETGEAYLAATQNLPPALADNPERMNGADYCYCLDTYKQGDLEGASNISIITCTRLKNIHEGTAGLRSHATIPLYAQGKKQGVMNFLSSGWRELSSGDLRLLNTVGDLLSMAIERARLFERSAQLGAVEERNRIAREIHDTVAQGLTAVALQLESADALLELGADANKSRELIQHALAMTRINLEEVRRSVLDLRAAPLEGKTLRQAIELTAQQLAERHDFEVSFIAGDDLPLPVRVEMGVFRIVQEALNNVVEHAQAEHVEIRMTTRPDQLRLVVEDDGRGFDTGMAHKNAAHEGCYGLVGMNERARLLGGTLRICSAPGEGTVIDVTIPLKDSA